MYVVGIRTMGVTTRGEILLSRSSNNLNSKEREARGNRYDDRREIENDKAGHELSSKVPECALQKKRKSVSHKHSSKNEMSLRKQGCPTSYNPPSTPGFPPSLK